MQMSTKNRQGVATRRRTFNFMTPRNHLERILCFMYDDSLNADEARVFGVLDGQRGAVEISFQKLWMDRRRRWRLLRDRRCCDTRGWWLRKVQELRHITQPKVVKRE